MKYPETALVKDAMADPIVVEKLGSQMDRARDGCAVASLYQIHGDDTIADSVERMLSQHPAVSVGMLVFCCEFMPEPLVDRLLDHIATDDRCVLKALRRIKDLTPAQRERLHGNR